MVGRLSQGAVRIDRPEDLARLDRAGTYADRYEAIAALAGAEPGHAHGFVAEELLQGREVTLEGYVREGRVTTIGVTDSVMYPGTITFERFEYPSALPAERRAELVELATRIVPAHGLDDAFFNIEFFVSDDGPAGIIELNARLASQFAPLVLAVHGRSTYDALFALACGDDPAWAPGTPNGVGVSYVVRVFEDAYVEAVPEPADDVEVLVRPGLRLSEQGANDAQSYRLAILYGHGADARRGPRSVPPPRGGAQLDGWRRRSGRSLGLRERLAVRDPERADQRAAEREPGRDEHPRAVAGHGRREHVAGLVLRERIGVGSVRPPVERERDDEADHRDGREAPEPRDGRVHARGDPGELGRRRLERGRRDRARP